MTAPTPTTTTPTTPKIFSWQELATHNTPEDAWLAIRGKVYDVTHWWPKHPGGKDVILFCAGKDATQLFECYHPLRITTAYLQKSYMGELESSEHPTYPPMSDFYKTLKSRVEAYFEETKQNPKFSWSIILRSILLVVAMLAFHALGVSVVEQHRSVGLVFAALAGVCSALLCLVPVHEASHASITNRPFLWRLFGSIHDFVNGASFYSWIHQHFLGHHFYTNTTSDGEGASWLPDTWDPDVVTGDPDIRRIKSGQKYHWHYQYQHIYAPILYGLLSIKFRINDFSIIFLTKKNGAIRVNNPGLWHTSIFFLGKLVFVFYRLILPSFFLSFYDTMSLFLTTEFVLSYYLACAFQVNHVVPQVAWPRVDSATNTVNMDWARSQVETTIEYGHGCALTHFFTGGLNYQSIHHLVPFVSQAYYPEIAPLVKKTCAEFNVTYTVLPNFWEAFKAHVQYLRMMGHTKQA